MTDEWQGGAGSKWFLFALVLLFVLVSMGIRGYGIKDPWVQGQMGQAGADSGNIARDYVRFGYAETRLGAAHHVGPVHPEYFVYDDRPPLIYWLTSLSYRIFGISEWSTTLVPILCSAGSIALLFMLAFRWWGLSVAVLAAAFMTLIPMDAYYGRLVSQQAPTLCAALLAFYLYILWKETRSTGYLVGVFGALALTVLSGVTGYFVAPWLAVYHAFTERRNKGRWFIAILLFVSSPVFFLAWAAYLHWIDSSNGILGSIVANSPNSGYNSWVFTLSELYGLAAFRIRDLYTSTLTLLSLVWAILMARDVWHRRDLNRHSFVVMLGGFGASYLLLFHQNTYQYDFAAYYLTPFFCLAAAWAVALLIERFLYGRWHILAALALIVFFSFFGEAAASLRNLYGVRHSEYVAVAQYLNKKLPEDGEIIAIVGEDIREQWLFYIDRPSRDDVTELPLLEWLMTYTDYHYFVLDTRRAEETTLELRDNLIRHYSAEAIGPFLIFDLHKETPNMVTNERKGILEQVSGEQFQYKHLNLLGYEIPHQVTWNRSSIWDNYLYSSDEYHPAGSGIPIRATLYWQSDGTAPTGYAPAVVLRTQYDRTFQLDPQYSPQFTAYPPESWDKGDIIRTDYFFNIPEGYPSTRYLLSIASPDSPSRLQQDADRDWIPVTHVSVLPLSLPEPLDNTPQPKYALASTPVEPLQFLGYDLQQEKVKPGETIRIKTYWTAEQGMDEDYVFIAELRNGTYVLAEPFADEPTRLWEPGLAYRVSLNLILPAEILAGQYPLSLRIRGADQEGIIPLTTLEVVTDQQIGLIRRWGEADRIADMSILSPGEPLQLNFELREPRALNVLATWTGSPQLDQTFVEVYAINDEWHVPRKYLTTWVVGQGALRSSWAHIPESLTRTGTNTIELKVPPAVDELHLMGWRGILNNLAPGLLQRTEETGDGTLDVDFVQVTVAGGRTSWEEFYDLAQAYAERDMWNEVKQVYRKAHERGTSPVSPEDLQIFFEAERRAPDADLKSQLESRLAGITPNRTDIVLGDRVEFLGYDMERTKPEHVSVNLFFRALKPTTEDLTVWIHAVPSDPSSLFGDAIERGYFTLDHILPSSSWKEGGVFRDSYEVVLPPDNYDFSIGLSQNGHRLWRDDNPDSHAIELGHIDLSASKK